MHRLTEAVGRMIVRHLQRPAGRYRPHAVTPLPLLRACLRPADVLLVEGVRDFDLSPYFALVKPAIERGFDYRALHWNSPAPGATPLTPTTPPA